MKIFETGSSRLCSNSMRDRSRILWTCSPRSGAPLPFRELIPVFNDCSMSMSELRSPENGFDLKKENNNDNQRKSLGTSLERSRLALTRWQGLFRRWLLPQRADRSGSRPDEERLRNRFREPERQHAAPGCQFSYGHVLRWGRGQAKGLSKLPGQPGWA